MSDETLTFSSEEKRMEAIQGVDDNNPEGLEELKKIQEAEIVEPEADSEQTEETPAKGPESEPEQPPEAPETPEQTEETPETGEKEAESPTEEEKVFKIKPEDLPENYDTPGKVFKTVKHQAEFIKKQNEQMERMRQEMETLKTAPEKPSAPETPPETPEPVNYDNQIKDVQEKLKKQYDEDPLDASIIELQGQLISLNTQKTQAIIDAKTQEVEKKALGQYEEYRQTEEQKKIEKLNKEALDRDYFEIDEIGKEKDYADYKLSKPAKEVEEDFFLLRDNIVKAYFGRSAASWGEVNHALTMFNNKSPNLMQKLQAMDVPTDYPQDVSTFLELSKLLNERDGVRYNANGEQEVYRTRWDPVKGSHVADRFPDLKATIEHQRVNSGHYKEKVLSAYDKGTKDMLNAQNRRDTNELQPDDGRNADVADTIQNIKAKIEALPDSPDSLKALQELQNKLAEMEATTT